MAKQHGLNQQISTLNVLKASIARAAINGIEPYDNLVNFHMRVLDEIDATLRWLQVHETVIRHAIKSTQKLDDSEGTG